MVFEWQLVQSALLAAVAVDFAAHGQLAGFVAQFASTVAGAVHVAFVVQAVEAGTILVETGTMPAEAGTTPVVFEKPQPAAAGVRRGLAVPK